MFHTQKATFIFNIPCSYSVIQFLALLSDCCTFLTAPHAVIISLYLLVMLLLYVFVSSFSSSLFSSLTYYQATAAVLSQPMCWLVFLFGLFIVSIMPPRSV
jgi:hypothetical protein